LVDIGPRKQISYITVYYGIHKRSECIPVDGGVTILIHDHCSCIYFTLGSRGECGCMRPLRCEQARHECDSGGYETFTHSCVCSRHRKKK